MHIEDGSDADTSALGSVSFEDAVAQGSPERDFGERSADDIYVIYTGGTTGMPKGVMWRHEDIFFALGQGIDALTGERVASEYTRAEQAAASETPLVFCVIPPLMHGAAQIATLSQWFLGSTLVLIRKFDAELVWELFEHEGVNSVLITGDAMARPLIDALDGQPRPLGPVQPDLGVVLRRAVLAVPQGPLPRAVPEPDHHRLDRLDRVRASTA